MKAENNAEKMSPAQITALLESLPVRVLLEFIKGDPAFAQKIFHGFTVRDNSLKNSVVRTRLKQELGKMRELAQELRKIWDEANADLLTQFSCDKFTADENSLAAMYISHGEATLRFALLCDARDEVNIWAEKLGELRKSSLTIAVKKPAPIPVQILQKDDAEVRMQITILHKELVTAQQENTRLRTEVAKHQGATATAEKRIEELQRKLDEAAKIAKEKLEREGRRAKKAEEDALESRKQLRMAEKKIADIPPAGPPAQLNSAAAPVIAEAIALLQRGLLLASGIAVKASTSKIAPALVAKVVVKKVDPSIELLTAHGKKTFILTQLCAAFVSNNRKVVDEVRDALTRLTAPLERKALAELAKVQIPEAVLRGPLRPALVDGSNVANMNKDKRARLAYLGQVQQSAWAEGYFPVIIYADASLPHQIDNPDLLLQLIERGEIIMTEAGTSADETLIKEARRLGAIIITNDRMNDWPDARHLDRRHVEIINGSARVGDFQRNSVNFNY